MNRKIVLCLWLVLLLWVAPGCQQTPGRDALRRLQDTGPNPTPGGTREEPHSVTKFVREPADGEPLLEDLRESLVYWAEIGVGGKPRWDGVLAPDPPELYERLVERIDDGDEAILLTAYRYDSTGLDALTLVDYSDADGNYLGTDTIVYANPIERRSSAPTFVGYKELRWWEGTLFALDVPIYLAIGVKEFAAELIKSPLSFLDSGVLGPLAEGRSVASSVSMKRAALAVVEDWMDGWTSLSWRFRVRRRHTPVDLVRDLAGAVPLAGPLFDHRSPPPSDDPPRPVHLIALSQGIHLGDASEQFMDSWRNRFQEMRPTSRVVAVPYSYGGVFDVVWSVTNLSHGFGYGMAEELVFGEGVRPGDAVELGGFSGGAQRSLAASRALRYSGVRVSRLVGVAGPMAGASCAVDATQVLGANAFDDPVVLAAHVVNGVFVFLPTSVSVSTVREAGGHHAPYLPNGTTRAPESGYRFRLEALFSH